MNYNLIAQRVGEILGENAEYHTMPKGKYLLREVNTNEVSEDEVLSYSVFCYKAECGLKVA